MCIYYHKKENSSGGKGDPDVESGSKRLGGTVAEESGALRAIGNLILFNFIAISDQSQGHGWKSRDFR